MNKFTKILFFSMILLTTGIIYQNFYRPAEIGPIKASGNIVEINMKILENLWEFEPSEITVRAGDKIRLHILNEDTYDHGFAIEIFGVNRRLFPKRETTLEFIASKEGTFTFYCSVPCGEGHYSQTGLLNVEGVEGVEEDGSSQRNSSNSVFSVIQNFAASVFQAIRLY